MEQISESGNNIIMQEDMEYLANDQKIPIDKLQNSTVLVTGATGLLGSQIVRYLLCLNRVKKYDIKVIALARNEKKAVNIFGELLKNRNLKTYYKDIVTFEKINERVDYIIHTASMTASKAFVQKPVETIETAIWGTNNLLKFAQETGIKGMVYLSSLEVYGTTDFNLPEISEESYGYIEPLDPRSSYSEGKRMAECLCSAYFHEYGLPVKIVRLTQTFGPGVDYNDNRVFAQFARSIIEKRDIILHTKGETVRDYCYSRDAIAAIFTVLIKGEEGEAYNVANEETTISIYDMAYLLTDIYKDTGIKVKIQLDDIQKHGYAPKLKIKLDVKKLKELGWNAEVSLAESYERLIRSMILSKGQVHSC